MERQTNAAPARAIRSRLTNCLTAAAILLILLLAGSLMLLFAVGLSPRREKQA